MLEKQEHKQLKKKALKNNSVQANEIGRYPKAVPTKKPLTCTCG
jgi:hypothetical protein